MRNKMNKKQLQQTNKLTKNPYYLKGYDAGVKHYKQHISGILKDRLKYCEKQNGLPYCKNCGLSEK